MQVLKSVRGLVAVAVTVVGAVAVRAGTCGISPG